MFKQQKARQFINIVRQREEGGVSWHHVIFDMGDRQGQLCERCNGLYIETEMLMNTIKILITHS